MDPASYRSLVGSPGAFVAHEDVSEDRWFASGTELPKAISQQLHGLFEKYKQTHQTQAVLTNYQGQDWTVDFQNQSIRGLKTSESFTIRKFHPTAVSYSIGPNDDAENFLKCDSIIKERLPQKLDVSKQPEHHGVVWLRQQFTKQNEEPKWEWYSKEDTKKIEEGYQNWLKDGKKDENFPYCPAYKINFLASRQYKSSADGKGIDKLKRRVVRRMLVCWHWSLLEMFSKEDQDKVKQDPNSLWRPYTPQQSYELEYAYVHSTAFCDIEIEGYGFTTKYRVNLASFLQYNTEEPFRKRHVCRLGPPLQSPQTLVHLDAADGTRFIVKMNEYPPHWEVDPNNPQPVRKVLDPNSETYQKLKNSMNTTIGKFGHGRSDNGHVRFGRVPGIGSYEDFPTVGDPKYFEVVEISEFQTPDLWRQYQVQRGRILCDNGGIGVKNSPNSQVIRNSRGVAPLTELLDENTNEYRFFHGTSGHVLHNFVVPAGLTERASKGGKYGRGIYLSDISSKSNQYISCPSCGNGAITSKKPPGEKLESCGCPDKEIVYDMLVCRVLLGDPYICTQTRWPTKRKNPPPAPGKSQKPFFGEEESQQLPFRNEDKAKGRFNSLFAVDKHYPGSQTGLVYQEYVVFDNDCVYPEFIIRFKRRLEAPKSEK